MGVASRIHSPLPSIDQELSFLELQLKRDGSVIFPTKYDPY